jgi:uncharacterized membrane protein YraQ (UPF0718 family)
LTWRREWKALAAIAALFMAIFYAPVGAPRFDNAVLEALSLARWYAREHVILCLLPAFYIAGAIAVFVSKGSIMKYLGAGANKALAYGVASVSGTVLAVCSCTVLPLFAGIYRMGAGLGPATAFLYSGPAINVLAIVLTARVLGVSLGVARAIGAVVFSILIGLSMHLLFRSEERRKAEAQAAMPVSQVSRPLWMNALYFAALAGILVFANWGRPGVTSDGWFAVYSAKWAITGVLGLALGLMLVSWLKVAWRKVLAVATATVALAVAVPRHPVLPFATAVVGLSAVVSTARGEAGEWFEATWGFAKQILPLLLIGVLVSGALLGRPGHEGLIPSRFVSTAVGGNSLRANLFASVAGAFMYFATLTEVPIVQGLLGSGMGGGPALALLLAGPALSLPSMLVIRSVMGTKKALVYILLVILLSTLAGFLYGTSLDGG